MGTWVQLKQPSGGFSTPPMRHIRLALRDCTVTKNTIVMDSYILVQGNLERRSPQGPVLLGQVGNICYEIVLEPVRVLTW